MPAQRARLAPCLVVGLLLVVSCKVSAQQLLSPFARVILPQPLEKQPFREVAIPAWVRETCGVGYTLSVLSKEDREQAVAAGVTISEMGFVDPFYAYYDSQYLKKRNPHVAQDHLEKELAEYRRLGLKVLAVYPPTLQSEAYELHPDWRRIATNTTEIPQVDLKVHPHGGMLCPLGPYGNFFIDVLKEITTKFQVDAFSFDGLHYGGVCYCQHCRESFREETGGEIPDVNMDDPAFRKYQHWADRRMEDLLQRMQTRLKGIKPDVALVTWTTNAGRFGHLRDIPRNMPARMNLLFDAPDQEFWLDESNRGATIVPSFANAYAWAVTNHRVAFSEPYLMSHGNPYGKDSFPAHEIERRVLLAATHGVCPSLAIIQPPQMRAAALDAWKEVQRRKEWLLHRRPEPWAALLVSDNTRVFYGRQPGKVEERYLAHVFGCFRAGLEEHLPVTLVNDWNMTDEDLAPYKVLILPNAACLDERQMGAIRRFVERGGGLVATMDTSLCDELGNTRPDFGLGDLLGVSHRAAADGNPAVQAEIDVNFAKGLDEAYWEKRKNVFDLRLVAESFLDESRLRKLIGTEPVTLKGAALEVVVNNKNYSIAATIENKGSTQPRAIPAVVTGKFGQGKVVYLAAGIDAGYYLYPYPYQRLILRSAIDHAASLPAPIRIQAPMCVQAGVFRQTTKTGERLLIHLFNDVNTTAFHALPNDDVPLREETIPIHDIRISLENYSIARVHQEPEGIELTSEQQQGGSLDIIVPKLNVQTIVVVELNP